MCFDRLSMEIGILKFLECNYLVWQMMRFGVLAITFVAKWYILVLSKKKIRTKVVFLFFNFKCSGVGLKANFSPKL